MVEVVVKFNSKKMVGDIKRSVDDEKRELTADLYNTILRRSPVRSGKFKKSWRKIETKTRANISNPQPYAQKLEFGPGKSKDAPNGVVRPSIEEVIKRRQTIRRK
jgi:hypothetical protein